MMDSSFSGVQASAYAYVAEFHSPEKRSTATSFVSTFMTFTSIYLPILAWIIVPKPWLFWFIGIKFSSWRIFLLSASSLNVINIFLMLFMPESPKFLLSMGRKKEALEVLHQMYQANTGNYYEVSLHSRSFRRRQFH